ncbi:MAG: hypothetical protein ACREMK_00790 [Gemmatimonadota bacterium]
MNPYRLMALTVLAFTLGSPATIVAQRETEPRLPGAPVLRAAAPPQADFAITTKIEPAEHLGPCPAEVAFIATIAAKKAGPVKYRLRTSDNAYDPVREMMFTAPGTKTFAVSRNLPPPGSGWGYFEIVGPVSASSEMAYYDIKCTNDPVAPSSARPPRPQPPGERSPTLGQPAPTVQAIPGGPLQLAEAELVTTSAALQPPLPTEGQKIKVLATVQNQGGMPSQNGLGLLLMCDQLPGQPKCPGAGPFSTTLPSIPAGQIHQATVSPAVTWPAGKYRLVVGTDMIFANDFVDLELVVKPTKFGGAFDPSGSYGGVPMREGEVQEQDDLGEPGEERGLNPQPEPPSAEARPGLVPHARVRAAAAKAFMAPLWNGKRVDLCLVWGGQCGEPAATEFCKLSGYAEATDWKPANDIGSKTPTVVLSSSQVCSDASCDGFASITCSQ